MIEATHFDGCSGRGRPVRLRIEGAHLVAEPGGADIETAPGSHDGEARTTALRWPLHEVIWPERTRHGQRVLQLRGGGSLQVSDGAAFDAWRRQHGPAEGWVVRLQQHWPATLAAVVAMVGLLGAGYLWGVPAAARVVVDLVPPAADRAVGDAALQSIGTRWLEPTGLPAARQAQLRAAFAAAVQAAYAPGPPPAYEVQFAVAASAIGPNAFALPGGTIVVTDALVELLQGRDDALLGVLAHELGHVRHRHGMRALVQVTLVGTVTSVVVGDFSSVLAGVPALVAQLGYSRDAEREADVEAVRVLRAAGLPADAMVVFFERLPAARRNATPLALASHPPDADRVRFFREAALGR